MVILNSRNNSDRNPESMSLMALTQRPKGKTIKGLLKELSKEDETLRFYYSPMILMDKVSRLIYECIDTKIKSDRGMTKYNSKKAKLVSQILANDVKNKMKSLQMNQYRFVSIVSIIPKFQQGVDYKMCYYGDHNMDLFGNTKYETNYMFIIGTVYLVYKR